MPIVSPKKTALIFNTTMPEKLNTLFPKSIYKEGRLAVPYNYDSVQLLRNMGLSTEKYEVIDHKFSYPKVKLMYDMYPHAKETTRKAVIFARGYIMNEPRLGKTSSAIAGSVFLQNEKLTRATLIIAPLSTLESVWLDEIRNMVPNKSAVTLFKKNLSGLKRKQYCRKLLDENHHFYIVNPDGVKVLHKLLLQYTEKFQHIIIDESTEFGNPSTARWKVMYDLTKHARFFWMMTGTPGDPMTVYGQAKMMSPDSVPSNKDIWRNMTMQQVSEYKWVPRASANALIQKALTPCIRFKKRDVFKDMPKELVIPRHAELSKKQEIVLHALREDGGAIINSIEVSPANAAVVANKALQISSGTMILDQDNVIRLPIESKLETLIQIMKEGEYKTIIYANYRETISHLADLLNKKGYSTGVVHGGVKLEQRSEIFRDFQNKSDPEIIVAHPKTVSFGVELGAADQIIFWGVPQISAFRYKQAKERLYSSHQKSDLPAVYQLYSLRSEKRMFDALEKGDEWQVAVADLFNELAEH